MDQKQSYTNRWFSRKVGLLFVGFQTLFFLIYLWEVTTFDKGTEMFGLAIISLFYSGVGLIFLSFFMGKFFGRLILKKSQSPKYYLIAGLIGVILFYLFSSFQGYLHYSKYGGPFGGLFGRFLQILFGPPSLSFSLFLLKSYFLSFFLLIILRISILIASLFGDASVSVFFLTIIIFTFSIGLFFGWLIKKIRARFGTKALTTIIGILFAIILLYFVLIIIFPALKCHLAISEFKDECFKDLYQLRHNILMEKR